MNNRLVPVVLMMFGFLSCTKPVEEIESPINKEDILHNYQEILGIVNNRGFIPIELMHDDFSISEIDFSKHWVLNEIGLQDVSLRRMNNGIEVTFKSQLMALDGLVMQLTPKKDGFRSELLIRKGIQLITPGRLIPL